MAAKRKSLYLILISGFNKAIFKTTYKYFFHEKKFSSHFIAGNSIACKTTGTAKRRQARPTRR